jgi:hypothetical protein
MACEILESFHLIELHSFKLSNTYVDMGHSASLLKKELIDVYIVTINTETCILSAARDPFVDRVFLNLHAKKAIQ